MQLATEAGQKASLIAKPVAYQLLQPNLCDQIKVKTPCKLPAMLLVLITPPVLNLATNITLASACRVKSLISPVWLALCR